MLSLVGRFQISRVRSTKRAGSSSQALSFGVVGPIQREIQFENVDVRFPENTELASSDVGLHHALNGVFGEITRGGNARHLIECGGRRNIRVQA